MSEEFDQLKPEEQIAALKTLYRWDSDDVSLFDRQCPGNMKDSFYKHDKTLVALLDPKHHEVGLNLGCGCGRVEAQWADRVGAIHAVDFSRAAIVIARREVPAKNVFFYENDGRTLSEFASAMFDFAWSEQVFQHVPREITRGYLKEIARVLKPGGRFVCQIPRSAKYDNVWHCGGMTVPLVEDALSDAGFSRWEYMRSDGLPGEGVCPADQAGDPFYIVPRCTR